MIINKYLYRRKIKEYPLAAIAKIKGVRKLIDRKIRLMGYSGKPLDLSLNATAPENLSKALKEVSSFIKK